MEPLGGLASLIAAGQPDVAPDQPDARGKVDASALYQS